MRCLVIILLKAFAKPFQCLGKEMYREERSKSGKGKKQTLHRQKKMLKNHSLNYTPGWQRGIHSLHLWSYCNCKAIDFVEGKYVNNVNPLGWWSVKETRKGFSN